MSIGSQESSVNEFYHLMQFRSFVHTYRGDRKKFVLKHARLNTCMRIYREMEAILQRKTFVNVNMDKIRTIRYEEKRKDQTLPVLIHQLYKHCTIISRHSIPIYN